MKVLARPRPAAPVQLVHLGLGNFFRAHQAWYTHRAPDGHAWGIAAFCGRGSEPAAALAAQDGLYTLVTRAADGDGFEVVTSLSGVHPASDHDTWLAHLSSPLVGVVTLTVTEAAYPRCGDGSPCLDDAGLKRDIEVLRTDLTAPVMTVPARLVAGLAARRARDAGPLAVVSCDNLPGNGAVTARSVRVLAEAVDPALEEWIGESVSFPESMVDRITPRPDPELASTVASRCGYADRSPVVTEPHADWVLAGAFPAGRPAWDQAGATMTDDVTPFESRKLLMLNGAHSLLAYVGLARGHRTVADAMTDDVCRDLLVSWWEEAATCLPQSAEDLAAYRAVLLGRFENPRTRHRLDQIGTDGSQKLPIRVLPVLRQARAAGRMPVAAVQILAAWLHCLGGDDPVDDVRADELGPVARRSPDLAVPGVLSLLDPALAADAELVTAVGESFRAPPGAWRG